MYPDLPELGDEDKEQVETVSLSELFKSYMKKHNVNRTPQTLPKTFMVD